MSSKYTASIVTVTPGQAQEWLTDHAFEGQRPVREGHVNYLANEIKHGRFEVDQIVLCDLNGASCLTDGQHRLAASVLTGETLEFNLLRRACQTLQEVQEDYRRRDRGLSRSPADCFRATSDIAAFGLNASQVNSYAGAFVFLLGGFTPRSSAGMQGVLYKSADLRIQFMKDWAAEALAFFDAIKGADRGIQGMMARAPVVAVAIATLRHQPEIAKEFWSAIAADDGLTKGSPEKAVLNFLYNNPSNYHAGHVYARYLATAWNARFERREVHQLKAQWASNPMLLKGTPYNGKDVVVLPYE